MCSCTRDKHEIESVDDSIALPNYIQITISASPPPSTKNVHLYRKAKTEHENQSVDDPVDPTLPIHYFQAVKAGGCASFRKAVMDGNGGVGYSSSKGEHYSHQKRSVINEAVILNTVIYPHVSGTF